MGPSRSGLKIENQQFVEMVHVLEHAECRRGKLERFSGIILF
jgi:hypothetical protein